MIPKIIHHSAPADKIKWHPLWLPCYNSWKKHFHESEYQYIMWNDEDCDWLVREHFPHYIELYNLFPFHIMRLDFTRLLMLLKYGGIYSDMDMYCYKNFYVDLDKETCIIQSFKGDDVLLMNCLMASTPNNDFIQQHLEDIKKKFYPFEQGMNIDKYICEITGPWSLSDSYDRYKGNIKILKNSLYNENPLSNKSSYITKHISTSIWGDDTRKHYIKDNLEDMYRYLSSNKNRIDLSNWDFYTSYEDPWCQVYSQNRKKKD